MTTTIPPELLVPWIDELTDALVNGRAKVPEDPGDGWTSWSCTLVRDGAGYELHEWSVLFPRARVETVGEIALDEALRPLLEHCEEHGIERPERLDLFFNRSPAVVIELVPRSLESRSALVSPGEEWCGLDSAAEPVLQELFRRWGDDSPEARRGQRAVRDPDLWWSGLTDEIEEDERELAEIRELFRERLEDTGRGEMDRGDGLARTAERGVVEVHEMLFRRRYTRGDSPEQLAEAVEAWYQDTKLAFGILALRAGTETFASPPRDMESRIMKDLVHLLFAATLLGREDIARDLLSHPAVSHVTYRPLDILAQVYDVPQASGLEDMRHDVWREALTTSDKWVKLAGATKGRRQAAFEKLVREGDHPDARGGLVRRWCLDAAVFAVLFALDDGPVRDLAHYPHDLVDHAREIGVPPLAVEKKLPGAWKKPTPPKVLEPAQHRAPLGLRRVEDELSLADFAALTAPVGGEPAGGTVDGMLDAAIDSGTVLNIGWRGVDPEVTGAELQLSCAVLGLQVPGRIPPRMPRTLERAMARFDEWLEPLGARLLQLDLDADDAFLLVVLAEDFTAVVGRSVEGMSLLPVRESA